MKIHECTDENPQQTKDPVQYSLRVNNCSSLVWTRKRLLYFREFMDIPDKLWSVLWRVDRVLFCPRLKTIWDRRSYSEFLLSLKCDFEETVQSLVAMNPRPGRSLLVLGSGTGYVNCIAAHLLNPGDRNVGLTHTWLLEESRAISSALLRGLANCSFPTFTDHCENEKFDFILVEDSQCPLAFSNSFRELKEHWLKPHGSVQFYRPYPSHHTPNKQYDANFKKRLNYDFDEKCLSSTISGTKRSIRGSTPSLAVLSLRRLVGLVWKVPNEIEAFCKHSDLMHRKPMAPLILQVSQSLEKLRQCPHASKIAISEEIFWACSQLYQTLQSENIVCNCPFSLRACGTSSANLSFLRRQESIFLDILRPQPRGAANPDFSVYLTHLVDALRRKVIETPVYKASGAPMTPNQVLAMDAARMSSDASALGNLLNSKDLMKFSPFKKMIMQHVHSFQALGIIGFQSEPFQEQSAQKMELAIENIKCLLREYDYNSSFRIAAEMLLSSVRRGVMLVTESIIEDDAELFKLELSRLNSQVPFLYTAHDKTYNLLAGRLLHDIVHLIVRAKWEDENSDNARRVYDMKFRAKSTLKKITEQAIDFDYLLNGIDFASDFV